VSVTIKEREMVCRICGEVAEGGVLITKCKVKERNNVWRLLFGERTMRWMVHTDCWRDMWLIICGETMEARIKEMSEKQLKAARKLIDERLK